MEVFQNEKQKFSLDVLYAALIMVFSAYAISYFFYLLPFELVLSFSLIKILLFFGLFFLISKTFHLYDFRYALVIGLISGLVLFFVPHIFNYYSINQQLSNNTHVSFMEYFNLYFSNTHGTIYPFGTRTDFFDNVFFEIFKFIIIVAGTIYFSLLISGRPYSKKMGEYFDQTFSLSYNKYEEDYLDEISKENFLEIILLFLNDKKRFVQVKAKKGLFALFELDGDLRKIALINNHYYLLNSKEYGQIENVLMNLI